MTKSPVARLRTERGVTSAEYAVVTAAGCGFATVLIKLLTSDFGQQLLKTRSTILMTGVGLLACWPGIRGRRGVGVGGGGSPPPSGGIGRFGVPTPTNAAR